MFKEKPKLINGVLHFYWPSKRHKLSLPLFLCKHTTLKYTICVCGVWGVGSVGGARESDSVKAIILVINYIYEIDKCCYRVFGILIPCCLRFVNVCEIPSKAVI